MTAVSSGDKTAGARPSRGVAWFLVVMRQRHGRSRHTIRLGGDGETLVAQVVQLEGSLA
jgi:hypothetical protein